MTGNRRTAINLISSLLVMFTNLLVGFILSPYLIENIGVEANGFVSLANNFVTYGTVIVIALNSMAARFVLIAYTQKDYQKANLYYNSVFWGNLLIVLVLLIPAAYLIARLEYLIDVPTEIIPDVKILFTFSFLGFFLQTGLPNWNCGAFVTNRLHRSYIPAAVIALVRCGVLLLIFALLSPHVWYVGFVSCLMIVATLCVNAYNTHLLTPELHVVLKPGKWICSFSAVKDLVGSGIWNSILQVGTMLLVSINLMLSNLFLGATAMGVFSVAHMLQNQLATLSGAITQILYNVFATVNKVKSNGIALLLTGFASLLLSCISLEYTQWGLYGLFAIPAFVCWVKNMAFVIPYAARYLGMKKSMFFPDVLRSFFSITALTLLCKYIYGFFSVDSWMDFILAAIVIGSICFTAGILIFLNKEERKTLLNRLSGRKC